MRFKDLAVATGILAAAACAGGEKNPADTTTVKVDTAAAPSVAATPSATPAATGAMAPITGTTYEVKMIGDAKGYRFEPASLTIKPGDGVKFVNVIGGPHNVAFDAASLSADMRSQLDANMGTDKMGELSSGLKMNPNETVTVSFGNIKPGTYAYHCVPHLAMNMKGTITVQ